MKGLEFPIIGTKVKGLTESFDLNSTQGRKDYFQAKVGDEISQIKNYLKDKTFVAYLIGKKNSGKGTYSKMFRDIFDEDKISVISVGDLVRDTHANWKEFVKSHKYKKLKDIYRGYISFEEAVDSLLGRSTSKLLPSEFILALLKLHLEDHQGKAVFIDGLPREIDQVSYSLYFRDLMGYRDDPDFFVLIDIPESVIDERIKTRVVCPVCQSPRNVKLLITSKVGFDAESEEFYLLCDNPGCNEAKMVAKEGDNLGIEPIRGRLEKDEEIIKKAFELHGVPKILLRNHVPISEAKTHFDPYELTPQYSFKWDAKEKEVKVSETPWMVKDDNGVDSNSLLPQPVVVALIKQMVDILRP